MCRVQIIRTKELCFLIIIIIFCVMVGRLFWSFPLWSGLISVLSLKSNSIRNHILHKNGIDIGMQWVLCSWETNTQRESCSLIHNKWQILTQFFSRMFLWSNYSLVYLQCDCVKVTLRWTPPSCFVCAAAVNDHTEDHPWFYINNELYCHPKGFHYDLKTYSIMKWERCGVLFQCCQNKWHMLHLGLGNLAKKRSWSDMIWLWNDVFFHISRYR